MNINSVLLSATLLLCMIVSPCMAQKKSFRPDSTPSAAHPPRKIELPVTTTWKFGISMTGTGDTNRTQVTFPVPVEWPEQKIRVISIDASENVSGAKITPLGSDASQLFFKVLKLASGEVAEASVTIEIEKLESVAPQDTNRFVFAEGVKGKKMLGYLTPSPFIESKDDRIIELAENLPIDPDDSAWDQVESIYTWVRDNIEYKFDTKIQSCLTALDAGHGDCEELSSLFIALCRARGIPARAVWIPEHTYPEFYLEDAEGKGHWFPCQCAGSYAFGHMPEAKPILQKGDKFKVKGHKKPTRYIQPTMKTYGASPQWEWKMEQIREQTSDD